jgi:hypothetical protein
MSDPRRPPPAAVGAEAGVGAGTGSIQWLGVVASGGGAAHWGRAGSAGGVKAAGAVVPGEVGWPPAAAGVPVAGSAGR